jgi:acyl-[acyl carrier protein]--UDP-N-acetylglucosamine O-acyltransferase
MMPAFIHPSAIVDEGAEIGDDSRVWHFVHVRWQKEEVRSENRNHHL